MDLAPSTANVRVAIRIRPLSSRERQGGSTECISVIPGTCQIVAGPDKSFTFDNVFPTDSSQDDIFASLAAPVLNYFLDGYNCTILAYGQTGSGKTFTMGTGLDGNLDESTQGIVPRSIMYLHEALAANQRCDSWEMFVSFLEIYNEDIIDLLAPPSNTGKKHSLSIREDAGGEIYLTGIKEETVRSPSDVYSLLQKGTLCRTTKSTDMNLVSSRSHAIFSVILRQVGEGQSVCSKLHFVDLAGSERLKRTNASGDRAKESISINSGLLALGNVISALGDESQHATHIPYRDSKLTRLLQDSLGGNSRTLMIACVSPSTDNYNETLNTLKYANRARNIKNRIQINQDANGSAAFEIVQLKKQVAALKQELLQARSVAHSRTSMPMTPQRFAKSDGTLQPANFEDTAALKKQNNDLMKRVEQLQREKILIEAERDALRLQHGPVDGEKMSVMRQHLTTIAELRAKLSQYEKGGKRAVRFQAETKVPHSPGEVLDASAELVERARQTITERLSTIDSVSNTFDDIPMSSIAPEQFKAAVETRVQTLLKPLREDLALKEELTHSLHTLQLEYMSMQQRYNERIKFLHDNIAAIQKERDNVLSSRPAQGQPATSQSMRLIRMKYEDRIKRMGKEINDLRSQLDQQNKDASSKTTNSDALLRSLRQTVQTLKTEKSRLQSQLLEESTAQRTLRTQQDTDNAAEMADLRARERKAMEAAKRWHKAYDFQKTLLQKRIEQCAMARVKIRSLLQVLRRNRVKMDSGCDTPGWRQIMQTPSNSNSASKDNLPMPMDLVNSPLAERLLSAAQSVVNTPKTRLAYGWIPTEVVPHLSPERPKPRDFFAQIADAASLSLRANAAAANQNPFLDKQQPPAKQ